MEKPVVGSPTGEPPQTYPVVCAEPSPDALQATAAAISASGSFSQDNVEALINAATSTNEAAENFGLRTQTIQLLRDGYFRLCEAYLSDGIDSIAYDVMQRRFQNQIIALLAVEQLTGVVRGSQASAKAVSEASSDGVAAVAAQLSQQARELEAAREAKADATEALEDNRKKLKT